MTDHPLTDEIIRENYTPKCDYFEDSGCELCAGYGKDDMRAAYDLAIENVWKLWNDLSETAETDLKLIMRFHSKLYDMRPQEEI